MRTLVAKLTASAIRTIARDAAGARASSDLAASSPPGPRARPSVRASRPVRPVSAPTSRSSSNVKPNQNSSGATNEVRASVTVGLPSALSTGWAEPPAIT